VTRAAFSWRLRELEVLFACVLRAAGAVPFLGVEVGRRETVRVFQREGSVNCLLRMLAAVHACAVFCAVPASAYPLVGRWAGVSLTGVRASSDARATSTSRVAMRVRGARRRG
jgi:hypothetical protein